VLARWKSLGVYEQRYGVFAILCLLLIWLGIGTELYWLGLVPFGLFGVYLAVSNYRLLFYALLLFIPLSVEMSFGGLGTDLPTEPLMIALSGIFILHFLQNWGTYDARYFTHPLALLLYAHVGWIFFSTLFSEGFLVSLKFSLAKCWYVIPFFLLSERFLRSPAEINRVFQLLFWPLVFVAAQSIVRHAMIDFDFVDQFKTIKPFMRNHVSYAGILSCLTPWMVYFYLMKRSEDRVASKGLKMLALGLAAFWFVAIALSYTRAAYVALILAGASYYVIRYRLLKPLLAVALGGAILGAVYMVKDDNYLAYSPNFETTVAHQNLNDIINATYSFEDVSTMERAYRWVAAGHMVPYHPWLGWGPGNFVNYYKGYTVTSFRTYVSANPENSGIHSYYLMTLVEQGFPGLIILIAFLFAILIYGERLYHQLSDYKARAAVMTALLSMIIIYAFLLINDMLETDKMGSIFFLNLAVIVSMNRLVNSKKTSTTTDANTPASGSAPATSKP
jgi:O-antigen ligase